MAAPVLYPLRFQPVLQRYLWGGRKLGQRYGKPAGPDGLCAESWEVSDLDGGQTVVANGPWAGKSLSELLVEHDRELLGDFAEVRRAALRARPDIAALRRFPLLIKLLDAAQPLSVQVHPDAARGALLQPPELGKTEAWYVLEAEPGSRIYAGLQPGVDRKTLERVLSASQVDAGEMTACLASFEPAAGDCILLPAGTVHALGAGVVVFEVQTPCDVTWRLFDWNRVGADGRPRPLHLREGLEAIDFTLPAPAPRRLQPGGTVQKSRETGCERLLECESFVIDRWRVEGATTLNLAGFHVLHVVQGELHVGEAPWDVSLSAGETLVAPAALREVRMMPAPRTVVIDVCLPEASAG